MKRDFINTARSTGLEPATFRVTGGCSNQLSYDRRCVANTVARVYTFFPVRARCLCRWEDLKQLFLYRLSRFFILQNRRQPFQLLLTKTKTSQNGRLLVLVSMGGLEPPTPAL